MVTMSQKEFQQMKVIENAAGGRLSVREASGIEIDSPTVAPTLALVFGLYRAKDPVSACSDSNRKGSENAANSSVERQLTDEAAVGNLFSGWP
jgi:hypothetical protein